MKNENSQKAKGFTIVELLTVMGVIVVLISLLLPALSMVRDFSREIQQKAQFHGIEVGLGMYEHDFGSLPPSADNVDDLFGGNNSLPDYNGNTSTIPYCGAMKLAEAMVGADLLGFHPQSGYYGDGLNKINNIVREVYNVNTDQLPWQTAEQNLDARKGPYIDLENANAFRIQSIYNRITPFQNPQIDDADGNPITDGPLVLCDAFVAKRQSGEKTGMPVLYFKARTQFSRQDYEEFESDATKNRYSDEHEDDIYFFSDNYRLLSSMGVPGETNTQHPVIANDTAGTNGVSEFEKLIVNNKVTTIKRPYRATSFILWSAGKDGLYGTSDDIFNFDKDKE